VMKTGATTVASDRRGEAVVPALRTRANELTRPPRSATATPRWQSSAATTVCRRQSGYPSSSTRCATS
jgi:hypothetical protein